MNTAILIPVYNADNQLLLLLEKLYPFKYPIVLVNDGSITTTSASIFQIVDEKYPQIILLNHTKNQGKGAALRTGITYISSKLNGIHNVVTADADGQHLATDILNITEAINNDPGMFILGTRDIAGNVPWKSVVGNSVISFLFKIRFGTYIADTQTGLRAIPNCFLQQFLALPGNRYDYETAMMAFLLKNKIPIKYVPITTVYINDNKATNFKPFTDSLRIIKTLLTA